MAKYTFLHLDDSYIALKVFEKTFENDACIIKTQTFEEAQEYLRKEPDIDCFVIDYHLRGGTGLSFIKSIRKTKKYEMTPVILLTSTATESIAFKAMKAGVNQTISKIVPPADLKTIIFNQIKNPYIQYIKRKYMEIRTIEWSTDKKFYQYCPAIRRSVAAPTSEKARDKMEKLIKKYIFEQSRQIDEIDEINSITHYIHISKK